MDEMKSERNRQESKMTMRWPEQVGGYPPEIGVTWGGWMDKLEKEKPRTQFGK